ncbi:MAG TPA: NAD-dependent epimerase/dehydratase family protein [Gaiellales bacterium]|nr:NAD-dependent epimerase/dehydratase family protein [Gaiellales bacterium]
MSGRVVVTGGLGFIGSAFVRALAADGQAVLNVDADTYAGDDRRLAGLGRELAETVRMDVADEGFAELVRAERPPLLVHFAAETHVTRSEDDGDTFFRTNVDGTRNVLDAAVAAGVERVVHISTDEIYGPCPADPFREDQKLPGEGLATSAYARSKALADDLARAYADRLAVVIARPTNCIGPWQHPEKAIPRWATRALRGERLPVWGDGLQIRDWMFVDDAVSGLRVLAERGEQGTAYNLGPAGEAVPNVEIARMVARAAGASNDAVYLSAYDRPQHDRRYAVSTERVAALGWAATRTVQDAVAETVAWYRDHAGWWQTLVPEAERLYAD